MTDDQRTIFQRMADISKEVSAISKTKKNVQQNFMFRGIDDVYNHFQPLLAKHGIFTVPEVLDERTEDRQTKTGSNLIYRVLRVKYTMYAPDGSNVSGIVTGEGMDSGDKASSKAMSIAHKYFVLQTFFVPTQDIQDPESESVELIGKFITTEQVKELSALIAETDSDNEKFWKFAGAETVDTITAKDYQKILVNLKAKAAKQKNDGK